MPPSALSGPDLDGVIADANSVELPYVVIGGFSVIALADRGQDRLDLEALKRVNGELPVDPIPGLDT